MSSLVGFTGTRHGMTDAQRATVANLLNNLMIAGVHHGMCVGADAEFHAIATLKNIPILKHPPTDTKLMAVCKGGREFPAKPYHDRNRDIVDMSNWIIAAPAELSEQPKGGTWYTIRYARSQGIKVHIVWPDGTQQVDDPWAA